MKTAEQGFTLIELMIVVIIIGILSAIAIPKFSNIAESARYTACRSNLRNIATALNLYLAENDDYPSGNGWNKLSTISDYVHTELLCPTTGASYRYRIMGGDRDTFRIRGWDASCKRNHGWYKNSIYVI